eukprot:gene4651-4845_t
MAGLSVTMLGAAAAGKTCLVHRLVHEDFLDEEYDPTLEDECTVEISVDGKTYHVRILDTAGEEISEAPKVLDWIRRSNGYMLVYGIENRTSFDALDGLFASLKDAGPGDPAVVVVGNKTDKDADRAVDKQMGADLAAKHHAAFVEVSAESGEGVPGCFEKLVELMASRPEPESKKPLGPPPKGSPKV